MPSIRQNAYPDVLPDFRNLAVIARVLLAVNALALAAALYASPGVTAALDRRKIRFLDDAGARQHARMGKGGGDILRGQPPIEINRGAEALYALVDRLPEAARPRLRLARHARTMGLNTV